MSISLSQEKSFEVNIEILNALNSDSPLELKMLSAAGISSDKIKKIYKKSTSKTRSVKDNYKAFAKWKKVHKRSEDKISAVLREIFQFEKPEKTALEIELFLKAGGTLGQVRNFLFREALPTSTTQQIAFLENVSLIANLETMSPETQKTSTQSVFWLSGNHFDLLPTETVEELKLKLARKFSTDTTFILTAATTGHEKLARMVIGEIDDLSKQHQILLKTIQSGDQGQLRALLKAGFNPNAVDLDSNSLLISAILEKQLWAIPVLLEYGTHSNRENNQGITPIHYAVNFGLKKEVRLLVEQGANINHQTSSGTTALHRIKNIKSTPFEKMEMWNLLIKLGADPTIQDLHKGQKSNTPLGTILHWGEIGIVREAFKGYPEIIDIAAQNVDGSRIKKLMETAFELTEPRSSSPYFFPLEIPFLLQSHPLASAMTALMSKEDIEAQIAKIRKKYPYIPLRVLSEASVETNKSYVLNFGETIANKTPSDVKDDASRTKKVARLIEMLDHVLKYRKNSTFRDANGRSFTPIELREKMVCLVEDIKNRQPKPGTPSHEKPDELENWYRYLEATLCEIIDLIDRENDEQSSKEDPAPNAATIIEIALTGGNCGGWYMGEAQKIKQQKKQENFDLPNQVFIVLRNFHERICQSFVDPNDHQNTHVMNLVYQVIDEAAGIDTVQKAARFYFLDPIPALDREGQSLIINEIYWKEFNPSQIVDEVLFAIHVECSINKELVIDWLKENVPAEWEKETFKAIKKDLAQAKTPEDQWKILSEKYGILMKTPRPFDQQVFPHLIKKHSELNESYQKALRIAASMQARPQAAVKFIEQRMHIKLDPSQPLEEQLRKYFLKQMPQKDQFLYKGILQSVGNKSYEEAAALLKAEGLSADPLPDIEKEIKQWRSFNFLSSVIAESGEISREAIVYLLTEMKILEHVD